MSAPKTSIACPWCSVRFTPTHHRQEFCTPAHSKAYSNRQLAEGQRIVALAKAWRMARNVRGKDPKAQALRAAGKEAWSMLCRELDALNGLDAAGGRMPALKVFARRLKAGLLDFQGAVNGQWVDRQRALNRPRAEGDPLHS